jgi:twitching motility two-component system response regulator PilG
VDKRPLSIVVIDDSPTVCKILEVALSREGHQVQTFQDPVPVLRAIFVAGTIPMPDMLFVDLLLPRINGYQVIMRFRNHSRGKLIPIIVISRLGGVIDRLKARLAGANDYLTKPFKMQDVVTLVERYATWPTQ